jgi:hypothetical protein
MGIKDQEITGRLTWVTSLAEVYIWPAGYLVFKELEFEYRLRM